MQWIDTQTRCLEEALAGPIEPNTFANAAVAGERLRRMLGAVEKPPRRALAALRRYDEFLREGAAEVPPYDLIDMFAETYCDAIDRYASTPGPDRDPEEGSQILEILDDICCIVAAAGRQGAVSEHFVGWIGDRVRSHVVEAAPHLPDLWQEAELWFERTAPDPMYPELYSWWDTLAALSAGRQLVEAAVAHRATVRLANRGEIDAFVHAPPPKRRS
jgi:hypothetical protein